MEPKIRKLIETDQDIMNKVTKIARIEKRSVNKEIQYILTEYVNKYYNDNSELLDLLEKHSVLLEDLEKLKSIA